jgi:hypothetical protein
MTRSESSVLLDGHTLTCVTVEEEFWWQIDLERNIKIYRIEITPSQEQKETTLNVSLLQGEKIAKSKIVLLTDKAVNVFIEPPFLSRIIRLQTMSDEKISLCEVEAFGTSEFEHYRAYKNYCLTVFLVNFRQPE